jgi:ketosteroid isomerase-like protein
LPNPSIKEDIGALELVEEAWRCLARNDVPAFLRLSSEDILWEVPAMPGVPFAGTWRGRNQVALFFQTAAKAQDTLAFEPRQFIVDRDTVVVLGHFINRVRSTGKESRSEWAQVWTVAGGKICGMREFVDTLEVSRAFSDADCVDPC